MRVSQGNSDLFQKQSNWKGITIEYSYMSKTGDFDLLMPQKGISVAFLPHDRATWSIDNGESQTTAVVPGNILLLSHHNFVWHYREVASEWLDIDIEPSVLSQIAEASGLPSKIDLDYRILFNDSTILHLAQLLKAEVIKGDVAQEIYIESLRNLLAVHLVRHYTSIGRSQPQKLTKSNYSLTHAQIKQLKDFIETNLQQKLSIVQLAAIVHLSPFHFARAFKQATGFSPHNYIIQRRLERAKNLLTLTQLSIQEIGMQVGYRNQSHFTVQFRKHIGTTPAAYRNNLK